MRWLHRLRPDRVVRTPPVAESMEPRLLFSADLAGALLLGADAADAAVEQRTLETSGEYAAASALTAGAPATAPITANATATNYAAMALTFEANQGQAPAGVDFSAYGGGYGISLQDGNAALTLLTADGQRTVTLELAGDSRSVEGHGEGLLPTQSNYVLGNDPSRWQTGIANYGAVVYRGVYDGIDVRYYGNQRQLEYDFIVAPGADVSSISLRFQGFESATVADNGDLVLRVAGTDSEVRFRAPVSYQRGASGLEAVASRYEIRADGTVGFVIGSYDTSRELVIDPVLDYASYFGTSGNESAPAIATDAAGNIYITGRTTSNNPPLGDLQGPGGGAGDIYVAKLSPDLTTLLFSTRIGGSGDEQGNAIAVDASGNIAVTGWTRSGDFPMQSAADGSRAGTQDSVIFKLNSSGALVFSTYFGGNSDGDSGNAVAMDSAGNVYVAGQASDSGLLPLVLQLLFGSSDNAFINKYNASGGVVYQELFGGSSDDWATGIALGSANDVYVVGNTRSSNWNANGGADGSLGGAIDGFLLHLDASGNNTYSTYIGAGDADTVTGVATDGNGMAYVVGVTQAGPSATLPTTAGAFQTTTTATNQDTGFLRIYDTNSSGAASLVYSSFLGGSSSDRPSGVAYSNGRVVIVGMASSMDFPITSDAVQSTHSGSSLYLLVIDPAGAGAADLHYGTYYAGDMVDAGGVAVSGNHVYVSGEIASDGWATVGAYQTSSQNNDAFVAGFTLPNTAPTLDGVVQPAAIPEDTVTGSGFLVSSLLTGHVTDPDQNALQGIAIIASNTTNGSWEYTTDGSNWSAITAPSVTSALLLAADAQTRIRFVPAPNFNGTVTSGLTIRAWDRTSGTSGGRADTASAGGASAFSSGTQSVNMVVTAVNDAPVANADTLTAIEDTPVTYAASTLLANDSDIDGPTLSIASVTSGTGGTVVRNADGSVTFTPDSDFNGTATFSYTASDGSATSSATVTVNVAAVNDAPVAAPVTLPAAAEDSGTVTITPAQLLANAGDADGDALAISSLAADSGTLLANAGDADGDALAITNLAADSGTLLANADGTWSFTPDANFNGTVSFTYGVSDGAATAAASASLAVTPVNDAPATAPVTLAAAAEDSGTVTITPAQLLANAGDADGDALAITGLAADSGTLAANADGTWSFTPAANFNGTVSFTYGVSDGAATAAASASLTVTPVNDAPATVPVTLPATAEDSGAITITPAQLLANASDADGDALAITNLAADSGTLAANANGTWSFTPAANFNGTVSFTYGVSDGVSTAAVSAGLVVTAVNDAPDGRADGAAGVEDIPLTLSADALPAPVIPLASPPFPAPQPLPPVFVAPSPVAISAGATGSSAGSRTSESLLDALGPAVETQVRGFNNTTQQSFGEPTARFVVASDPTQRLRTVVFDRTGLELISTQPDVELLLARFGIESGSEGSRLEDFQRTLRSGGFAGELDRLRESVREDLQLDKSFTISVASVSLGLTVAYVLWLIRGGVLLGSYLSALPAWRFLDPLLVLSRVEEEEDDEEPLDRGESTGRSTLRGFG